MEKIYASQGNFWGSYRKNTRTISYRKIQRKITFTRISQIHLCAFRISKGGLNGEFVIKLIDTDFLHHIKTTTISIHIHWYWSFQGSHRAPCYPLNFWIFFLFSLELSFVLDFAWFRGVSCFSSGVFSSDFFCCSFDLLQLFAELNYLSVI